MICTDQRGHLTPKRAKGSSPVVRGQRQATCQARAQALWSETNQHISQALKGKGFGPIYVMWDQ
eukprot:2810466-Amphidinium_carterae.1